MHFLDMDVLFCDVPLEFFARFLRSSLFTSLEVGALMVGESFNNVA